MVVLAREECRGKGGSAEQPAAGGLPVPLLTSPLPIGEYAIARDGTRLAWVTSGRPPEITFQWRTLGPGTEVRVRLGTTTWSGMFRAVGEDVAVLALRAGPCRYVRLDSVTEISV